MAASIERVVRNFTLVTLLSAVSASALAEVWIETSRNDDYLAYADPSSVRRDGDLVKMWSMLAAGVFLRVAVHAVVALRHGRLFVVFLAFR